MLSPPASGRLGFIDGLRNKAMELNREKLHAELREILKCPVPWEEYFAHHVLIDHLYTLWLAAVQQYP